MKVARINRQSVLAPSPDHSCWCNGCDRNLVRDGEKCEVCGCVNGPRRSKPNRRNAALLERVETMMEDVE